jgi:hypothetical protein
MTLSTVQISAQLERVLVSDPDALTVAIRAPAKEPWPGSLRQRGREFQLRWCESALAIREALCDAEQLDPRASGLVVLTPLATQHLAEDLAARVARARVYEPGGWETVRQLFQARQTDARLGRLPWMPQALIDGLAQGVYAPVANGFLDLETAWGEVLRRWLALDAARPDTVALLRWSMAPQASGRLAQLPAAARADVLQWLGESAGAGGPLVLACVAAGRGADALPLGLVCGVLFDRAGEGQPALAQAMVRMERFVEDRHVGVAEARAWAAAAEQVVRAAGIEACRPALDRADALLRDLRAGEFAHLSDLLPAGLDQRLHEVAAALSAHVAEPSASRLAQVEAQADRALRHLLLPAQAPRTERLEMARRLARWLLLPVPSATSLPDAATWQADQGAFVDWARFRLLGGDELPDLSQAYAGCREAVIARRNAFARTFAHLLAQWNAQAPAREGRVVPLEAVLDQVLAPLAAVQPVLLLVMDGLSTSIFRELFARLAGLGWTEMVPQDTGRPLAGVAAVPTITEVCRTSLLCGRLALGAAPQEKAGFASHAGLLAHSRAAAPPRLFHKGDLADGGSLAPEVRQAIGNAQQQVVGVVYNAVDDHLSGPDQLHQRWALEDLRLVPELLREAREARRLVVITADHGHLLEDGTTQLAGGADRDRWRPGRDAAAAHEVAVRGPRVLTGDGRHEAVCLWGESTRYGGRKNGYHGGLSPQEVTVPLGVIVPTGLSLAGWMPAPAAQPEWWELPPLSQDPSAAVPIAAPRPPRRKAVDPAGQPKLFEPGELPLSTPPSDAAAGWIDALLASPVYASQRQLAARVAPPDARMRLLLTALSDRGGKLSKSALAHRLLLPEMSIGGLLSAVRRVLNVDQAAVLTVDEVAGTVELNVPLLQQQFRLPGAGGPR